MYEKGTITLAEWHKTGMADSPYLGWSSIVGCNIFETPGILKLENATASNFTVTGMPIAQVRATNGDIYTLTDDGKLYKNGVSLQTGLTSPSDLIIYKDYVLITSSSVIHAYGPLSASPVFTSNWKTGLDANYYHKMVLANDLSTSLSADAIYITNGNTVAKISGFVAGTAGSPPSAGTLTTNVLTLPDGMYASTMCLLATNLMIGTLTTGNRVANIFPWDKLTTHSYDKPVLLNELGINAMLSYGNQVYFSAGNFGNIYVTDGTNYRRIKRIPFNQKRSFSYTMTVMPNAMTIHSNGNLLVGTSSANSNSQTTANHGVYEIDIQDKGYPCSLKTIISTGTTTGVNGILKIGLVSILSDDAIYVGWTSGSTYGFDVTSFRTYTSYISYAESPLIIVGNNLVKKSFQVIEFRFGRPIIAGQGIKIQYRKNLTDSYTTIMNKSGGTVFDYAYLCPLATETVISHNDSAQIADAEQLQFKISLTNSSSSSENLDLIYIKLW